MWNLRLWGATNEKNRARKSSRGKMWNMMMAFFKTHVNLNLRIIKIVTTFTDTCFPNRVDWMNRVQSSWMSSWNRRTATVPWVLGVLGLLVTLVVARGTRGRYAKGNGRWFVDSDLVKGGQELPWASCFGQNLRQETDFWHEHLIGYFFSGSEAAQLHAPLRREGCWGSLGEMRGRTCSTTQCRPSKRNPSKSPFCNRK